MIQIVNLSIISLSFVNYYKLGYQISIPIQSLVTIHIFSSKIFSYVIYFSSIGEIIFYFINLYPTYHCILPVIDQYLVLTSLAISCATGFQIVQKKYHTTPKHIEKSLYYLLGLALFWLTFDKITQIYYFYYLICYRMIINLVSCSLVYQINQLMKKKIKKSSILIWNSNILNKTIYKRGPRISYY